VNCLEVWIFDGEDIAQHVSSPVTEFRNGGIEGIKTEAEVRFTI
jgi:hypothetical protein